MSQIHTEFFLMGHLYLCVCAIFLCICCGHCSVSEAGVASTPFNQNYIPVWGLDHFTFLDQETQVQIRIDPTSGGGFRSRLAYGSGHFRMSLKIPKKSKGIITTFYLTSVGDGQGQSKNDELDFELLGQDGKPYTLHTNVFTQDSGHREQQFKLWFDPTLDFHEYEILWNTKQIVFFVDGIPIRVFKNNEKIGARYPKLPVYIRGGLWNGTQWLGPVDWNHGPFIASYRGFEVLGCPYDNSKPKECESLSYPWNAPDKWQLDPKQQELYERYGKTNIIYDYCKSDLKDNFPECRI